MSESGTYHEKLEKAGYLELEPLDFTKFQRKENRLEVGFTYHGGLTVDLDTKSITWTTQRESKLIRLNFSDIKHWDYVCDREYLQMIFITDGARYAFATSFDYTDLDQGFALAVACGVPFRHDYREQPGVKRVKRGSLLTPESCRESYAVCFTDAVLNNEVITVPIFQKQPLEFDLRAQRIRGPLDLAFSEVQTCLLDFDIIEGDEKTHYIYCLILNGTGFTERAKEYHNDMTASNTNRWGLQFRLAAIPLLCGFPCQTSFSLPVDPRFPLRPREQKKEPAAPSNEKWANSGCGCLLVALLAFLFSRG